MRECTTGGLPVNSREPARLSSLARVPCPLPPSRGLTARGQRNGGRTRRLSAAPETGSCCTVTSFSRGRQAMSKLVEFYGMVSVPDGTEPLEVVKRLRVKLSGELGGG